MPRVGTRILLSAGDPSGDLLGAKLAETLKKKLGSTAEIWAIGGENLKKHADVFMEDLTSQGVLGWLEPIRKLPFFIKLLKKTEKIFKTTSFDCVIPIDYYGFNIRLAERAKKHNIPVIYYISPQIWASRFNRIQKIKQFVDKVICLFPFEEKIYRAKGIAAQFTGHPLTTTLLPQTHMRGKQLKIGLMPGSRKSEVLKHLPVLLEVWTKINRQHPQAQAYLIKCREVASLYPSDDALNAQNIACSWGPNYQLRGELDLALCASGLATLENTMLALPMIVFYSVRPSWLYPILKRIVKAPYIAMPNILAGKRVVEEIHWGDSASNRKGAIELIAQHALDLIDNPEKLKTTRQDLTQIRNQLLAPNGQDPTELACEAILGLMHHSSL